MSHVPHLDSKQWVDKQSNEEPAMGRKRQQCSEEKTTGKVDNFWHLTNHLPQVIYYHRHPMSPVVQKPMCDFHKPIMFNEQSDDSVQEEEQTSKPANCDIGFCITSTEDWWSNTHLLFFNYSYRTVS